MVVGIMRSVISEWVTQKYYEHDEIAIGHNSYLKSNPSLKFEKE